MTTHPTRADPRRLTGADAGELFTLQRAAWVQEAQANHSLDIPPLLEDLLTVRSGLADPGMTTWGNRVDGRLIATVRTSLNAKGDEALIGRLGVVPDLQGQGWGAHLLRFAERQLPPCVHVLTLITGALSLGNHRFYERQGFRPDPAADAPAGTVAYRKERAWPA